jgi:hypothetical protein
MFTGRTTPTSAASSSAAQNAGDGVLWRIRTTVVDAPGRLAALCRGLADLEVNIAAIHVRPQSRPVTGAVVDEFVVIAPGGLTADRISAAIAAGGGIGTEVWLFEGDDLHDVPTPSWATPSPTELSSPGSKASARRTRL